MPVQFSTGRSPILPRAISWWPSRAIRMRCGRRWRKKARRRV